jgi:hypothetical protein
MKPAKWLSYICLLIAYGALLLHAFIPHHHHEQIAYFNTHTCPHHPTQDQATSLPTEAKCQTLEHAWIFTSTIDYSIDDVVQPLLDLFHFALPLEIACYLSSFFLSDPIHGPPHGSFLAYFSISSFSFRGPPLSLYPFV